MARLEVKAEARWFISLDLPTGVRWVSARIEGCHVSLEHQSSPMWSLTPETAAKHEILIRYLDAWLPILGSTQGRVLLIDGFAGPGRYSGGEPGSPLIALSRLLDHGHAERLLGRCEFVFVFCESDPERFELLEHHLNEFQQERGGLPDTVTVQTFDQPFADVADRVLGWLREQKARLAPTFAFLDPFGVKGLPMDRIAELLAFERCEVLVNLAVRNADRFFEQDAMNRHFNELFGTDRWTEGRELSRAERANFMRNLYEQQLRDKAGFDHTQNFLVYAADDQPSYWLVHGTRNERGVEKMKEAMWKADPTGSFRFRRSFQGQLVLFGGDDDTAPLRGALLDRFAGRTVPVEEVSRFVLLETPYLPSKHLKKKTLKPMENDGDVIEVGNRKKAGTFPDGCRITFAG